MGGGLVPGMAVGLADEQGREPEPQAGEGHAEEERVGPQPERAAMNPVASAARATAP